ncbi:MAG: ComEC/Rec2 family competence protein [Candidatus Liptonbacteria bacterium]|nr:ComEC/Rec2 family competence protein [Candidatus Liptonbacteria bacterium]
MEKTELPPGVGERADFFEVPANLLFVGAIAFLFGVLAASTAWDARVVLGTLGALGGALWLSIRIPPRYYAAAFLSLCFGIFYFHLFLNVRDAHMNVPYDERIQFSGVVAREPKFTERSQRFVVALEPPFAGRIDVVTGVAPERRYGDLISFDGKINAPEDRVSSPVSVFPKMEFVEAHRGFWIKETLFALKQKMVAQFKQTLPADSAALLSGLTLGARSDFTRELKEQMSRSGTTHLVALSGYNIGILVLAVSGVFGYFLSRRITFVLTTAVIVLFVLMVGAEASVVRAAIMGFLVLLAKDIGKIHSFRNPVTLTAAGMALFDPAVVRFDLGFALSFLSLLGIVYIGPAIENCILRITRRRTPPLKGILSWRENLRTTAAAQLAVAPLLILSFGDFSLTSLAANVLILGTVPLTMFFGFVLAGMNALLAPIGAMLAWMVSLLLHFQIGVIGFFSAVRFSIRFASVPLVALYYGAVLWFTMNFNRRTAPRP